MGGYPGLSSYADGKISDLTMEGLAYVGAVFMIIVCLAMLTILLIRWKNTKIREVIKSKSLIAFLLAMFLIVGSITWYGQPTFWGLIKHQGIFPASAEIKTNDILNWQASQALDTSLTVLETHFANMGANPQYGDMETAVKNFCGQSPVYFANCRVIDAQLLNPQEVVGTINGPINTGGLFNSTFPVNLSTHAVSLADLRADQAIMIWAEHDSHYLRFIIASKAWTLLQLDMIKSQHYPPDDTSDHTHGVFRKHYPLIAQDAATLVSKTDGNIDAVWAMLQDERNKRQPLYLDIASLTGNVRDGVYYVDNMLVRSAAHLPADFPKRMSFPGEVALSLISRATSALAPI